MKTFSEKLADFVAEGAQREAVRGKIRTKSGFIVRVELHAVEHRKDYDKLHKYLASHQFQTTIIDDNGVEYNLPTATYYHDNPGGVVTNTQVHTKAAKGVEAALEGEYKHVKTANATPTILVTKTDQVYWTGLTPTPTPPPAKKLIPPVTGRNPFTQ